MDELCADMKKSNKSVCEPCHGQNHVQYDFSASISGSSRSPAHSGPVNIHDVGKSLKRDLMVGYDKFFTPQLDGDKPVNVSAGLSVASMDMDD